MKQLTVVVPLLRTLIVVLFAGLIFGQVFSLPGQFSHMVSEAPQLGFVPWGLLLFAVLEVACLQVTLVCIWRLLSMVSSERIFSESSFAWVNGIVWAVTAGWVLLAVTAVSLTTFLYFTPELRDPGLPILLFGMTLIGGVMVLVVVVLRALLRQAAAISADLEEVI